MPAAPALRVAPVTPQLADAVRALRVAPGQHVHVGDVSFNLADAEANPDSEAMAILADDRVIGFYRLDYQPTVVARISLRSAAAVVLRAFLLDRAWQGRGLAGRALLACCRDVSLRHPRRRLMALNVDCRNVVAVRAYRQAGFVGCGELVSGGSAGPQHLMLRQLGGLGARG
ncbi:MAG: GNAT family N-acetyltransferase [Pseudomonadota bacterium]|nr:GNAT family N-acetyltransferase [Pseudomonadota bacterium]